MKTISWLSGVLLWLAVGMMPADAQEQERTKADTNREVATTYAQVYLEQKQYFEAEQILQYSLKNDGQDGGVLNLLGLIQMKQGNFAQACYSFQTASIVFKDTQDRIYALYNLADCFHRGGRRDDAIRVLRELESKETVYSNSAESALELIDGGILKLGEPLPAYAKKARGKFGIAGAVSLGFDTNVLLIEETLTRGLSLAERGSFYTTPSLQLNHTGILGKHTVETRWVSAFTNYFNPDVNSFNNWYNRADIAFGSGAVRWNLFGDLVFLNSSSFSVYNYDAGLSWQLTKKFGASDVFVLETPLRYQKFILANGVSEDNDRTGVDLQVRANYRSIMNETDFWSLAGTLDNQYSFGKNYRLTGATLPLSAGWSLPVLGRLGLVNTFGVELGGQYFWQSDLKRRDWWYKLGTGVIAPFFPGWSLTIDYYYLKNNSTVNAATYSKGVISAQFSKELF